MIVVAPVYVGALALPLTAVSVAVGLARGRSKIVIGRGEDRALHLAIRRFGNQTEYAPLALILMLTMELKGVGENRLHAYGATLVALRVLHAFILYDKFDAPTWRKIGRAVSAAGAAALIAAGGVALLV